MKYLILHLNKRDELHELLKKGIDRCNSNPDFGAIFLNYFSFHSKDNLDVILKQRQIENMTLFHYIEILLTHYVENQSKNSNEYNELVN